MDNRNESETPKSIVKMVDKNLHTRIFTSRSKEIRRGKNTRSLPSGLYTASGLKSTLHGVVYQLKLLMLYAWIGRNNGYEFRLATEMDEGEKFDDVVFFFKKDTETIPRCKLVQAKHIQDTEFTKITWKELLDKPDDRFSLYKYFQSHKKIKQKKSFQTIRCDYVICTNIGIQFDSTYISSGNVLKIQDQELFFEAIINNTDVFNKDGEQYRFVKKQTAERKNVLDTITRKFNNYSDLKQMCRELVECIVEKKPIPLDKKSFQKYSTSLQQQVLNVQENTIFHEFIAKRPQDCILRNAFHEALLDYKEKHNKINANHFITILENCLNEVDGCSIPKKQKALVPIKIEDNIMLIPYRDPVIHNVKQYAEKFADKFKKSKFKSISIRQNDKELYEQIKTLRGHVLVERNKAIKLSYRFIDNNTTLPGNLMDFKKLFLECLKNDCKFGLTKLSDYNFKITMFKTFEEKEVDSLIDPLKVQPVINPLLEEDIDNFLDDLVFCVNQPNADRLDLLIAEQIAQEFNLVNPDLISHEFMNGILHWMKEKQGPDNRFISEDSDIFVEVGKKIAQLITVGPTCEMVRKISELQLGFHESALSQCLNNFIKQQDTMDTPSLLCIFTPKKLTHLGSAAVLQELSKVQLGLKPGAYIFLRLNNWLHLLDEIEYALGQKTISHMIIEFKTPDKLPEYDQISYRINQLLKYSKKFIFIIDAHAKNLYKINATHTSMDFIPKFFIFDETSKAIMLGTNVNFQGIMCPLVEIIGTASGLVDLEMITKLTNKEVISIGHALWDFSGYDEDWYVSRRFTRQILIDPAILRNTNNNDIYAVIEKNDEHPEMFDQIVVKNFKNRNNAKLVELDTTEQFSQLCGENKKRNIHLLKCRANAFIWIQSQGYITELIPFILYEKYLGMAECFPENQSEEEFSISEGGNAYNKLLLISNEAGMGKSTVLSSMAHIIRKVMDPNIWILRLDLNDYTRVLFQEQNLYKINCVDDAIAFLVDKLLSFKNDLQLRTTFEKEIFKHYLKHSGKMILMIDGVDEISPNYEYLIIRLINLLRRSKVHKIFVTTRPHIRKNLEEKLGVFSYKMIPFSFENQQEFLRKFLCKKLDIALSDPENKYFIECINDVIKKLHSSISDKERSFMGIPLQMRMIAKIFLAHINKDEMEKSCQQFVKTFHTDLIKLYNEFIQVMIYDIYWTEKKSIDFSKTGTTELMEMNYKIFFKHYQELAVFSLFTQTERYQMNFFENFETIQYNSTQIGIRNVGLIEYVGDKPQFIHRSFAEYFVATYLINKLLLLRDNDDVDLIITQIFCKPQYQVIRAFLNNLLLKEKSTVTLATPILLKQINTIWNDRPKDLSDNLNNTMFHTAALEGNLSIIKFLDAHKSVENKESIYNLVNANNNRGDTILHSAVSKGYLDIIQYICALSRSDEKDMIIDFHAYDNHKRTAFFAAVLREDWTAVKWFIENIPEAKRDINTPKAASNHYIAHIAAKQGNLEVIQYLQEHDIDLHLVDSNKKTLLHSAVSSNQYHVVEWILSTETLALNMISHRDKNGRTPLMWAVLLGQQKIVELLLKKQQIDIDNPIDKNQITLMHIVAKSSNEDFVEWFIEAMKPDLSKLDTSGHTPLHKAATCGKLEVFKLLYRKYTTVTDVEPHVLIRSLANIACISNKSDILQWLIEQCDDKFHKTNILESILHPAAAANQPEQVSWILSQGININAADEYGRTPLHLNVRNGTKSDIEWLIDFGADLNALDNEKRSPLHYVVESGRLETIQLLMDKGANIELADKNGVTVFHLAAKSGHPDKIQLLCKDHSVFTSFLERHDNNKNTILHYVSQQTRLDQYIWILQHVEQDINARNVLGRTMLDNACFKGSLIIVKYLLGDSVIYHKEKVQIEKAADPNIRTEQNTTILHSAAISGNVELVKWLIEEKNIEILDSREILFAARYDRLDVVKYLSSKVDMNVIDTDGRNISHMACLSRHKVGVLSWLIESEIWLNFNTKDKNGRSPLLVAASYRNWDAVEVLLNYTDININLYDDRQWSFLHILARCGKFQLLKDLIENGRANDNVIDKDGRTLLHSASRSGSLQIVQYLINERHLKVTKDNDNCTLLHAASRSGNLELCEWLLTEKLCDTRSKDNKNRTALHFASRPGHIDLVKYLVSNHADITVVDNSEISILHEAAFSGNVSLVEWLVREQNMSIDLTDVDGNTIMHMAVRFGHVHIIDWLLTRGADINMNAEIPAKAGTVLHQACRYGQWYTAKYIIQRGTLVSALDLDNRTPKDIAKENKHDAIVDLLNSALIYKID